MGWRRSIVRRWSWCGKSIENEGLKIENDLLCYGFGWLLALLGGIWQERSEMAILPSCGRHRG